MGISTKMRIWIQSFISEGPLASRRINLNCFKSLFNGSTVWVFLILFFLINIITRTGMYLKVVPGCNVKPSHVGIPRRISLNPFSSRWNEFHSYQKASQLIILYHFDQVFREETFQRASIFINFIAWEDILDAPFLSQCLSNVISELPFCTIFDAES